MNARNEGLFLPTKLEDFLPPFWKDGEGGWVSGPRQTYRIIGKAEERVSSSQKQKNYWIIQLSALRSHRFIVEVPENFSQGTSITFMESFSKTDMRIRINRDQKQKGLNISFYRDPETRALMKWRKNLMYQKIKKEWVLTHVDGRII